MKSFLKNNIGSIIVIVLGVGILVSLWVYEFGGEVRRYEETYTVISLYTRRVSSGRSYRNDYYADCENDEGGFQVKLPKDQWNALAPDDVITVEIIEYYNKGNELFYTEHNVVDVKGI